MLKIINLILVFLYAVSSETKWDDTCQLNSCFAYLSFCNTCYGERQCIACLTSLNPNCELCAENIYEKQNTVIINETEYSQCLRHDELNQKLCHFYCRGQFYPTGQCNHVDNQLVCECLSDLSDTTLSSTTETSTTM